MNRYRIHQKKTLEVGSRVRRAEFYIRDTMKINPDFNIKKLRGLGTVSTLSECFDDYQYHLFTVDWDDGPMVPGKNQPIYVPHELVKVYE